VAAILGHNRFASRADVLREMVRQKYGAVPEFTGNAATEWGTAHEPDARAAYEAETGHLVEEVGLIVHPEHDWLAASPDGLVDDDGACEFKAPFRKRCYGCVPDYYLDQCQLVMACARRTWLDFYVWTPTGCERFRVERDPNWLDTHWGTLRAFMTEFNSHGEDSPLLGDKIVTRDDADWQEAADCYRLAKGWLADAQDAEKQAKAKLIDMAGDITTEGCGLRAVKATRQGNINYRHKDIQAALEPLNLDDYRGKATDYWTLKEVSNG
jgi:putative phage-type endonuclease